MNFVRRHRALLEGSVIALLSLVLFTFLHRHATISDPDAFYHAKLAIIFRDDGVPRTFPWLPLTTLAESFADQQLLYHYALIPFVTLLSPLVGLKVASVLFSTIAMVSFYALIRSFAPRWAFTATLALLPSSLFLFRLLLGKAQPLALALLFLLLIALTKRRSFFAFLLSALLVLTHGSWLLGAATAVAMIFLGGRPSAFFSLAGFLVGLFLHPAFASTLTFFWEQTVKIAIVGVSGRYAGQEWFASDLLDFFYGAPLTTLAFFCAFILFLMALERRKLSPRSFLFFALTLLLAFFSMRSRRYFEFFVPITIAAFASLFCDVRGDVSWRELRKEFSRVLLGVLPRRWLRTVVVGFLFVAPALFIAVSVQSVDQSFKKGFPLTFLSRSAVFIEERVPRDAVVILSNWSFFPPLFFNGGEVRYSMGLDPRFLLFRNSKQFAAWEDIFLGRGIRLSRILRDSFAAQYFFVRADEERILKKARADRGLVSIYEDDEAVIFQLSDG